jgi:D-lactate dehydrogenase
VISSRLHTPLNKATHHLAQRHTLAITKPGVTIVNTSRGKLIDTSSLIRFLKSGTLAVWHLDVYEEEEGIFFEDLSGEILQNDELALLLTFPNVLLTAHQAFLTEEALSEIARVTTTNIIRWPTKNHSLKIRLYNASDIPLSCVSIRHIALDLGSHARKCIRIYRFRIPD